MKQVDIISADKRYKEIASKTLQANSVLRKHLQDLVTVITQCRGTGSTTNLMKTGMHIIFPSHGYAQAVNRLFDSNKAIAFSDAKRTLFGRKLPIAFTDAYVMYLGRLAQTLVNNADDLMQAHSDYVKVIDSDEPVSDTIIKAAKTTQYRNACIETNNEVYRICVMSFWQRIRFLFSSKYRQKLYDTAKRSFESIDTK